MKTRDMPLSPIDIAFTGRDGYSIEFILYFPYRLNIQRLNSALQKTLKKFWPVGSELKASPDWGYLFADNSAKPFVQLRPSLEKRPNFENPREVAQFSMPVLSEPGYPLASFSLTPIGNGCLFQANISHCVVDGYSYFFFLGMLAANYRYAPYHREFWTSKMVRPEHNRQKLRDLLGDHVANVDLNAEEITRRTGLALGEERRLPNLQTSKWEFVRFPKKEIDAQVKQSAKRVSSNDILSALIWKHCAQKWHHPEDTVNLSAAFDYRRLFPTDLSPLYFGNAIRATSFSLPCAEVLSSPVQELALKIRIATDAIDQNAVIESLRCMEGLRKKYGFQIFSKFHVSNQKNGLLVTNLSRVSRSSLDFGEGPPVTVVPLTSAPRSAIVLSDHVDFVARIDSPVTAS